MVVRRKIVHLIKIVLAGKINFQNCPPALSLKRYGRAPIHGHLKNLAAWVLSPAECKKPKWKIMAHQVALQNMEYKTKGNASTG
jgi:hypothetical protein